MMDLTKFDLVFQKKKTRSFTNDHIALLTKVDDMYHQDVDYMPFVESDDDDGNDSSDDEIEPALQGDRLKQVSLQNPNKLKHGNDQDDFEKEMNAELNDAVKTLEKERRQLSSSEDKKEPLFYDEAYFDSDSDEDGTSEEKKRKQHPIPSNDELLYDPEADDEDQRWVDQHRQRYQARSTGTTTEQGAKRRKLPHSDAVLDCPACMTTLCLDCQRHDKFQNQYRAMFVMNCNVDRTQVLKFPKEGEKKRKKKKKAKFADPPVDGSSGASDSVAAGAEEPDSYHPVRCDICTTEVGVFDKEEVYHFFNVLASYS